MASPGNAPGGSPIADDDITDDEFRRMRAYVGGDPGPIAGPRIQVRNIAVGSTNRCVAVAFDSTGLVIAMMPDTARKVARDITAAADRIDGVPALVVRGSLLVRIWRRLRGRPGLPR